MKTLNFVSFLAVLGLFLFITSCDNASQKVVKAEENSAEAKQNLENAEDEYITDIDQYRLMAADKIAANERSIAEYNARIGKDKKAVSAEIKKEIADLEAKNNEMKMKIGDYKNEGEDKWEMFKTDFERDMDALGESISNIGKDNK